MSIELLIYEPDTGLRTQSGISSLGSYSENAILWLDIEGEELDIMNPIASHFGLHELSIEDCLTPGHFPKLDDYGAYLFMIFRGLKSLPDLEEIIEEESREAEDEVLTRKLAIFLSRKFIITYRRGSVHWLNAVVRQVKQFPETTIALGTDVLAYRIIDVLIDRFDRGLTFFEKKIASLEDLAIQSHESFKIPSVLELKRELVTIRQVVRDQRMVLAKLANEGSTLIREQQKRYFKDVDDHAVGIINTIDKEIDSLLGLLDAYFAFANVQLSDTMRFLAVFTTVAAPINIIVGIWGMNFHNMPLINSPLGFSTVIGLIILITLAMLFYFRKKRWI